MTNDAPNIQTIDELPASSNRSPVFPLPIFLLCGGVQRLRIFEQKYLDMVANCHKTDGFVISLPTHNTPHQTTNWGAHVQILDFDKGEDGVLTIDVHADRLVTLANIEREKNGLLTARLAALPHWSSVYGEAASENNGLHHDSHTDLQLSSLLQKLFAANQEFNKLYQQHYFEYPQWVGARLLEIVPVTLTEKAKFIQALDFSALSQFLGSLCEQTTDQSDP